MGTANSAGTHSDSVLAHYFKQKKKGVPMSTPGQQLAELHQRVVQEELGLPATIDDRDCVVFEHPELSLDRRRGRPQVSGLKFFHLMREPRNRLSFTCCTGCFGGKVSLR